MTAAVSQLIIKIQRDEFGLPLTLDDQPDLADIRGVYQTGDGNFWVAVLDEERIIGTLALVDLGGGHGALMKMFVASTFRGSRLGVGKGLYDALLAYASAAGFLDICLGTTSVMPRAHAFYEKNGFVEIDKADLPDDFPVMAVDSKFYRLVLTT
ncbi:MAG: GNAT family N-acetyltransferase [Alphaproteobacteria bacterium]